MWNAAGTPAERAGNRFVLYYPLLRPQKVLKKKIFRRNFTMLFDTIAELIAERTDRDVSEIQPDSKFSDLGIDSLDTVELLMEREDKIGKEVELKQKVDTIQDLVDLIEGKE